MDAEQNVDIERLLEEIDRSPFHRGDRQRNIAMRRDDDDRHGDETLFHGRQEFEAVDFWHAHVRHDAGAVVLSDRFKECSRGLMRANRVTLRRQQ